MPTKVVYITIICHYIVFNDYLFFFRHLLAESLVSLGLTSTPVESNNLKVSTMRFCEQ